MKPIKNLKLELRYKHPDQQVRYDIEQLNKKVNELVEAVNILFANFGR